MISDSTINHGNTSFLLIGGSSSGQRKSFQQSTPSIQVFHSESGLDEVYVRTEFCVGSRKANVFVLRGLDLRELTSAQKELIERECAGEPLSPESECREFPRDMKQKG